MQNFQDFPQLFEDTNEGLLEHIGACTSPTTSPNSSLPPRKFPLSPAGSLTPPGPYGCESTGSEKVCIIVVLAR